MLIYEAYILDERKGCYGMIRMPAADPFSTIDVFCNFL